MTEVNIDITENEINMDVKEVKEIENEINVKNMVEHYIVAGGRYEVVCSIIYALIILICMTICVGFTIYYVYTYNFSTIIMTPFIYSKPDISNSTIFMTPCYIGNELLEQIIKNNETLPNNYIYSYDAFSHKYYYLNTGYCKEGLEYINDITDYVNNINSKMENKTYLQINYNPNYLILKYLAIACIFCIILVVLCFASFLYVKTPKSPYIKAFKSYIYEGSKYSCRISTIFTLPMILSVIILILTCVMIQLSSFTYYNFDYNSNIFGINDFRIIIIIALLYICPTMFVLFVSSLLFIPFIRYNETPM
ncbi:hypothetical protein Hokovirus_1_10 [Hokovirus HKV1]|uniref:Uncharacterized protein n=1 Tax=Hokovirus HKV1 TaxID=1977638 RepID=A0A1V0SEM5_9VIRU|nr:hypothetical protein Hokovirus_1_10 [Hokovirus HKV1]